MTHVPRYWRWLAIPAVVVLVVGALVINARPAGPVAQRPGPYGSAIGADGLANTQIGGNASGSSNELVAYRFRAQQSGSLASIRIYLVDGSGYASGSGGSLSITIQTDDGSDAHGPSGVVLATAPALVPGNPISIGYLPLVTFPVPAHLVEGRLYDVVFEDTDPSPTENFVSINAIWTAAITTPRQPGLADMDWAELINDGSGWTVRPGYTPILDLGYAQGLHQGMGYMEVWADSAESITGTQTVREVFTPTAARRISAVAVRLTRTSGSSPLTATLYQAKSGAILNQGTIPAASFGPDPAWASAVFTVPVTLLAGSSYELRLSAPADTSYSAVAIERGNRYQFDPLTFFNDGHAEFTADGAAWSGFNQPGGTQDNGNSDLQFYFQ